MAANKCPSVAGHFDGRGEALKQYMWHCPMKHVHGYTGSHRTSPSGDYSLRFAWLSMTDLFSYLLPYPASVLRLDSDPKLNLQHLSFVRTLIPISTSLLVARSSYWKGYVWSIQEDHPSLSNRGSIHSIPPSVGCSPRLSYGSTATVISTELVKKS